MLARNSGKTKDRKKDPLNTQVDMEEGKAAQPAVPGNHGPISPCGHCDKKIEIEPTRACEVTKSCRPKNMFVPPSFARAADGPSLGCVILWIT